MTNKLPDAEALLPGLAAQLRAGVTPATAMIGLHTGGAWVAERLHPLLGLKDPLGLMDIAFYRDDYAQEGLKHDPKKTKIPFEVEGRDLLLVDDVLYTGRTVRAAMNELFDYGRPRSTWARRSTSPRASACGSSAPTAGGSPWNWKRRNVANNPQLNASGQLQHLLSIEGLPREILVQILDTAESFAGVTEREVKKVPLMRGKSVFNLFFEASTRTRTTFEIAAKRLSADVINLNVAVSSHTKGESLLDTVANLSAMHADLFVVRHGSSGAPYLIARHVKPHEHVINAGDGRHAHPTQGLLDLYTIRHYKKDFSGLVVAIVGDVLHSRVARSLIHGLTTLGVPEVRVIGPQTLMPAGVEALGVRVFHDMRAGLKDCDVVVMLRLQNERMSGPLLPSAQEFFKNFGLTADKLALARPDAIVMHPGPMNRGVEIDSPVADGPHSVILPQVTFGIAVRMAVMSIVAGN